MTQKEKVIDATVKELTLLVLHMTGWEDEVKNKPGEKMFFTWKHNFDVLNALENDQMIHQVRNGSSVILTAAGIEKAKELKKKYLGQ